MTETVPDEAGLRAELAELGEEAEVASAEVRQIVARKQRIERILAGPRVIPELCYWSHFAYYEDEMFDDETIEDGFRRLDSMEDYGEASTIGVRVGGYLITRAEWGWDRYGFDKKDTTREDEEHRRFVLNERQSADSEEIR